MHIIAFFSEYFSDDYLRTILSVNKRHFLMQVQKILR